MNNTKRSSEREKGLRRQGWKKQFVASEPKLSEAVALYSEIGYDVHLEPFDAAEGMDLQNPDGCSACFRGFEDQYRVIYTQPRKRPKRGEDDL